MDSCAIVEAFRTAPDDIDADFVFVCQDESMKGARLLPGNVVFIKACSDAEDGKIVLVQTSNGFMLRRLYHSENGNRANAAASAADSSSNIANTAADSANKAAESAASAANNANSSAQVANYAADSANTAATLANSARDKANTAATSANNATAAANQSAQAADRAASDANTARNEANLAAQEARTQAGAASGAAQEAASAAGAAREAAQSANDAAGRAGEIAGTVQQKLDNGEFVGPRGDALFATMEVDDDGHLHLLGAEHTGGVTFTLNEETGNLGVSYG